MHMKLRGKPNQSIFFMHLPATVTTAQWLWSSEWPSWVLQSKKPISVESVCLETQHTEQQQSFPASSRPQEQLAGLEPAQHRRAGAAVGGTDLWRWQILPELRAEPAKLSPSGETPFGEKRWQKMVLFWKKGDLKAVSRLFSWVMPATVEQELLFIF